MTEIIFDVTESFGKALSETDFEEPRAAESVMGRAGRPLLIVGGAGAAIGLGLWLYRRAKRAA